MKISEQILFALNDTDENMLAASEKNRIQMPRLRYILASVAIIVCVCLISIPQMRLGGTSGNPAQSQEFYAEIDSIPNEELEMEYSQIMLEPMNTESDADHLETIYRHAYDLLEQEGYDVYLDEGEEGLVLYGLLTEEQIDDLPEIEGYVYKIESGRGQ